MWRAPDSIVAQLGMWGGQLEAGEHQQQTSRWRFYELTGSTEGCRVYRRRSFQEPCQPIAHPELKGRVLKKESC